MSIRAANFASFSNSPPIHHLYPILFLGKGHAKEISLFLSWARDVPTFKDVARLPLQPFRIRYGKMT